MHPFNRHFWKYASERYSRWFNHPSRVLECGSLNINGSIREHFHVKEYVGLDWRPGPDVDCVSLVHNAPFGTATFDTIASASMLEHDPHWRMSVTKMAELMKLDGIMILTWAAALANPHELQSAPDGAYHGLKAEELFRHVGAIGLYIHQFQYERTVYNQQSPEQLGFTELTGGYYGLDYAVLVAFHSPAHVVGFRMIDPFMDADRIFD